MNDFPSTHLTRTETGWTVIHQGMPLIREDSSLGDCLAVGARCKLHLPAEIWIAILGRFGTLEEAKTI